MADFTESHVEDAALEWLAELGHSVLHGPDIVPDGPASERVSYDQVLLTERLAEALGRFNPHLPAEMLEEALRKVQQTETHSLIEENRCLHCYLIGGVPSRGCPRRRQHQQGCRLADRLRRRGCQRLAGRESVHGHRGAEELPPRRGVVRQRASLGRGRVEKPRRRERYPRRFFQPAPSLQGADTVPVPHERGHL